MGSDYFMNAPTNECSDTQLVENLRAQIEYLRTMNEFLKFENQDLTDKLSGIKPSKPFIH